MAHDPHCWHYIKGTIRVCCDENTIEELKKDWNIIEHSMFFWKILLEKSAQDESI